MKIKHRKNNFTNIYKNEASKQKRDKIMIKY